jgi:hypothetical protein
LENGYKATQLHLTTAYCELWLPIFEVYLRFLPCTDVFILEIKVYIPLMNRRPCLPKFTEIAIMLKMLLLKTMKLKLQNIHIPPTDLDASQETSDLTYHILS